jgi:hypothetical protein
MYWNFVAIDGVVKNQFSVRISQSSVPTAIWRGLLCAVVNALWNKPSQINWMLFNTSFLPTTPV